MVYFEANEVKKMNNKERQSKPHLSVKISKKKSGHEFKIEIKDQIKMHVEKVHVNYRVTVLPSVNVKLVSAIMRETIFVITLNNEQLFRPFI